MSQCSNGASPRKLFKLVKRLEPDFLRDVLDLAFAAGITARGGEDARRIFLDERLEAGGVAFQHRRNQFRFSPFHFASVPEKWPKSKAA